jgi:hypothetical protein
MTAETFETLYKKVWDLREKISTSWPTPDRESSLKFAVTEAAEAIDADLRKNNKWARNREKHLNVERELAQCAIMLFTAMGPDVKHDNLIFVAFEKNGASLTTIGMKVMEALYYDGRETFDEFPNALASDAINEIRVFLGNDVFEKEILEELNHVEEKYSDA